MSAQGELAPSPERARTVLGYRDLPTDAIVVEDRLRVVDPSWVEALAASMHDHGLDQPIVVRKDPTDVTAERHILVAGEHRLAAAKRLGWFTIRCVVRMLTEAEARLVEIDENLMRRGLDQLDRAIFLLERKRAWEELYPETRHGGDRKSRKAKVDFKWQTLPLDPARRFSAEAAGRIGLSERAVRDAIALAAALSVEAVAVLRGTPLADNAAQLRELVAQPAERHVAIARMIASGEAATVKEARIKAGDAPTGEEDPQERAYRQLVSAWSKASRSTRLRFQQHAGLREGGWPA